MAESKTGTKKRTTRRSSGRSSGSSRRGSNGRKASEKTEEYRFAQNVAGEGTVAEREYTRYATGDEQISDPDVLLDVPVVKVDRIHLEVDELDANVALKAKVLDLLDLTVGVDAHLGKLRIDIEGVEAQAIAKIRLDNVAAIIDRVLTTVDRNPDLVEGIGEALEDVGSGTGRALSETGEGVEEVGEGAGQAVGEIGEGAGQAVGDIGEGAGQAVGDIGEGAGQAVQGIGEGAGQATGDLGGTVGGLGEAVGQVGQTAGGLTGAAGGLTGAAGNAIGANGDAGDGVTAPKLAKEAVKVAAKQLGAAASDEAKDLGLAAVRKASELGERRREKRAEKHKATAAAMRAADEAGIDIDEIEGSGADGRIVLRDVREAAAT